MIQPLISLMLDQLSTLEKRGVRCVRLTQDDAEDTVDQSVINSCDVILASPEAILDKYRYVFNDAQFAEKLACIAIDECHIISEW